MTLARHILCLLLLIGIPVSLSAQQNCDHCGKTLVGEWLSTSSGSYHPTCYKNFIQPHCDHCGKPIEDTYMILGEKTYHTSCYETHIMKTCDLCSKPLEGLYLTDHWGNQYHKYHQDNYPVCSNCSRLISRALSGGGYELEDGRHICSICDKTAITEKTIAPDEVRAVLNLLQQQGLNGFPSDLPITLVNAKTLKHLAGSRSADIRGFTDHRTETVNGRVVSRSNHIYILSHLPRVIFRGVLAHELLHVYLFQRGLDPPSRIREGFCNLGSELVYQADATGLAAYQLMNMEQNDDPDYGAGYREMSSKLQRVGWSRLLRDLPHY